jgi:exodeoxyribonuclease V beta subunit
MEFWLPSDGLQARRLDALCQQHLLPGQPRPQLPERALKGMLMGFADLVFEHDGRFWVLDYKSNALGSRDGDYTREAMKQSILEHRYDVQAALYLLALHRLLKSRLGSAYAPERHLGGAIFFFLRGVDGPTAGCCEVAAPLALIEQLDAMLGPEAE